MTGGTAMKKYRILLCLLLVMLLLVGCGQQDEWKLAHKAADKLSAITDDPQLLEDTQQLLDALIANDYESARAAVNTQISDAELRGAFDQIRSGLQNIERYELVASSINKTVINNVSTISVRYMMTAGEQRYFVDVTRLDDQPGLVSFSINEYVPVDISGTLGNMQGANVLQWALLIIGLLEQVLVICVFVDCCRHKVRRKWLWLIGIALGAVSLNLIALPGQFRINMNYGAFLSTTALLRYSTGGFVLRITVPAFAVAYLIIRKKLFAQYERWLQTKNAPPTESADLTIQPKSVEPIPDATSIESLPEKEE